MERDEKINKAMNLLSEHDHVSWYQEAVNIVSDYIDYLETEIEYLETKITENR